MWLIGNMKIPKVLVSSFFSNLEIYVFSKSYFWNEIFKGIVSKPMFIHFNINYLFFYSASYSRIVCKKNISPLFLHFNRHYIYINQLWFENIYPINNFVYISDILASCLGTYRIVSQEFLSVNWFRFEWTLALFNYKSLILFISTLSFLLNSLCASVGHCQ